MNALVEAGEQSASVANLLEALAAAHEQLDNVLYDRSAEIPIKDKATREIRGKFKYRYSSLPAILNHVRPELTKNGIWYTQKIRNGEMITRLFHKSGEWMDSGHIPVPDLKGEPMAIGAIISFFKRYSLTEALGIASEEDDDDSRDSERGREEIDFRARGAPQSKTVDDESTEEPPEGWGDWTRAMIRSVQGERTLDGLDVLRDAARRRLNALKRHDQAMFDDIGKAFTARRAVLDKDAPV